MRKCFYGYSQNTTGPSYYPNSTLCSAVRLSFGMSWDWVQGGDPLHATVFSLSSCHCHIWPILVYFSFVKSTCHMYCPSKGKKIGVQNLFQPPQIEWFLRAVSLFHNCGYFPKIEGRRLWWSHLLLLLQHVAEAFPKLRVSPQFWKTSRHPAMIKQRCNRQGNDKELLYQNWGPALNSGKATPPERNRLFWGLKHSENSRMFFHTFLTYAKFTFCKKWSKTTNPALSSGLKKTLSRM